MKPDMPVYSNAWTEMQRRVDPRGKIGGVPVTSVTHGIGVRLWMATRLAAAMLGKTGRYDDVEPGACFDLADRLFDYYKNEPAEDEPPHLTVNHDDEGATP